MGQKLQQNLGTAAAGRAVSLTPSLPQGARWRGQAVGTWLPPLLGFTNTSRGFMRGDGVGLMMKGLQRPSLETQRAHKALSCLGRPRPRSLVITPGHTSQWAWP